MGVQKGENEVEVLQRGGVAAFDGVVFEWMGEMVGGEAIHHAGGHWAGRTYFVLGGG